MWHLPSRYLTIKVCSRGSRSVQRCFILWYTSEKVGFDFVGWMKREGVVVFVVGVEGVAMSVSFVSAVVPSCADSCIENWEIWSIWSDI